MPSDAPCSRQNASLSARRRRGDHACTEQRAELDGGDANATRRSEHEQRLAGLDRRSIDERVIRGRVREQRGRADFEAHRVGQLDDGHLGRDDPLGKRPVDQGRRDAIANGERGHAGADGRHDPRGFATRRERCCRAKLILAARDQHVGEVDARRLDVDHDLATAGGWLGQFVDAKRSGTCQLVAANSAHARP